MIKQHLLQYAAIKGNEGQVNQALAFTGSKTWGTYLVQRKLPKLYVHYDAFHNITCRTTPIDGVMDTTIITADQLDYLVARSKQEKLRDIVLGRYK